MTSPYATMQRSGVSMRSISIKDEDPVKLIEQLQSYIVKIQNTSRDVHRRRPLRKPYEKLSFDFQQSRDLPPVIRAIVEDNRMLRKFLKEWKARCRLAENEAQKERLRTEQCRLEFASYQETFSEKDLLAIENHKKLEEKTRTLQETLEEKERVLAILEKKRRVDAKMHQVALSGHARETDALKKRMSELEDEIHCLKFKNREEILGTKRITAKYEVQKRRTMELKEQMDAFLRKEENRLVSCTTPAVDVDDEMTLHAEDLDKETEQRVVLMLCVVMETATDEASKRTMQLPTSVDKCSSVGSASSHVPENLSNESETVNETPAPRSFLHGISSELEISNEGNADLEHMAEERSSAPRDEILDVVREAAAVKIQCAFRRLLAKKELERRMVNAMQHGPKNIASHTKTSVTCLPQRHAVETPRTTTKGKQLPQTASATRFRSKSRKPTLA